MEHDLQNLVCGNDDEFLPSVPAEPLHRVDVSFFLGVVDHWPIGEWFQPDISVDTRTETVLARSSIFARGAVRGEEGDWTMELGRSEARSARRHSPRNVFERVLTSDTALRRLTLG